MLEVAQIQPVLQRATGCAQVSVGGTGLQRLYQQGCAKILFPKTYFPTPEAVIVNTAGGLTGGDVFEISCDVKESASICVTSQTAERIYRAKEGEAAVTNALDIADGGYLEWLPQETILFEGCGLSRRLDVRMGRNSKLLSLESLILGRKAMGENLKCCKVNDQWRIKREGKLIYADGVRFGPDVANVFKSDVVLGGALAFASLVYVAPDAEDRLEMSRELLAGLKVQAAASAWNGMLVTRFLAPDGKELRGALIEYLEAFRHKKMPRVWHM